MLKKYTSLVIFLLFVTEVVNGQTPNSFTNIAQGAKTSDAKRALSANSVWAGGQIGYKFGDADFSDNLLVSARLLYEIDLGYDKFHLPVMGNISSLRDAYSGNKNPNKDTITARVQELLLTTQGVNVGLYPYYTLFSNSVLLLTAHGSAILKLNSFKVGDQYQQIEQGRFTAGIEISLGKSGDDKYPLTLSVAPALNVFNSNKYDKVFGENRSTIASLEITGVMPIGNGFGLLIEGIVAEKQYSALRVGIVIAANTKK